MLILCKELDLQACQLLSKIQSRESPFELEIPLKFPIAKFLKSSDYFDVQFWNVMSTCLTRCSWFFFFYWNYSDGIDYFSLTAALTVDPSLPSIPRVPLWLQSWSTSDMSFSLCQLQEKYREQQIPLSITFIDLTNVWPDQQERTLQATAEDC